MKTTRDTSEVLASLLNFCIAILNVNVLEVPTGKEVFGIASSVLAFVRVSTAVLHPALKFELALTPDKDTMIDDDYAVRLLEYCFNACEALKGVLQGKMLGDLNRSEKAAIKNLERCAC
jgi:hypothetical protein